MIEPIYVFRPLLNQSDFVDFAIERGFPRESIIPDMHVTLAYSRDPVNWNTPTFQMQRAELSVEGGERRLSRLGPNGEAVVLTFESRALSDRWAEFILAGASWDFEQFIPHVTLAIDPEGAIMESLIETPQLPLRFGGEMARWLDVERAA